MKIPAIILAGGLGTRLQGVVKDVPKPMAPVNGKPFLHYVFTYLKGQDINKVILSVGYKAEAIRDYFGDQYMGISILYMEEKTPLGTGGGIYQAISFCEDLAYVINGDTFFDVDLAALHKFYTANKTDIAIALKPLSDFDRYGTVVLDKNNRISKFVVKKAVKEGLINGGVYLMSKDCFRKIEYLKKKAFPRKFSFEKEVLERYGDKVKISGLPTDTYFIDIGIPEDYEKAQKDFKSIFGK